MKNYTTKTLAAATLLIITTAPAIAQTSSDLIMTDITWEKGEKAEIGEVQFKNGSKPVKYAANQTQYQLKLADRNNKTLKTQNFNIEKTAYRFGAETKKKVNLNQSQTTVTFKNREKAAYLILENNQGEKLDTYQLETFKPKQGLGKTIPAIIISIIMFGLIIAGFKHFKENRNTV